MNSLVLLCLTALAPSDAQVLKVVNADFELKGRSSPMVDVALSDAARQIAERALKQGVDEAASLMRVTAAVSKHGGWDPSPTAIVIRGGVDELLATLAKNSMADEPASFVGTGVAEDGARGAVAVLLARRKIELGPFSRAISRPSTIARSLCGTLKPPLSSAEVFVTRPDGAVDRHDMTPSQARLCSSLSFASAGRHTVEVLAHGPRGPEVAALFFVDVGAIRATDDEGYSLEPKSDDDARAQLLVRINALRLKMGLSAVQADRSLESIAQDWAKRLAQENFFYHVAPDGSDLKQRLAEGSYRYRSAGENLGLSSGPLSAHFGIEHSPGHRKNLLEKDHQRLGIGLARRADGMTVLVEILASPSAAATPTNVSNPLEAAYTALATERARLKLPKLKPSPTLEALAQQHALAALEAQSMRAELPGRQKLHEQVFDTLDEVKTVSVDFFIAETPALITDSKNLSSRRSTMVGIGVAQGDSAKYGNGRYWIVVIYAGPT